MTNHHETFDELAAVYAVGALDGDDLVRFEAHLRDGCPECEAVLREATESLASLARSETPMIPPAHVRDALLRRVDASSRPRPVRFGWLRFAAVTAAAAIAAAASALDKAAKRGAIHPNSARRRRSRIAKAAAKATQKT
jgi:anti-sigma-K factor RskA